MQTVYLDYCEGVPRLICTNCGSCSSVMGTSLCSIKERGCCSYFPEYNLYEIQKLVKLPDGRDILDIILKNPGTDVYNYHIHAKGNFEIEPYQQYLEQGNTVSTSIKDHTVFFRTCPFVIPGKGCMFEPQYRTTVCNFFICSEILERVDLKNKFNCYIDERTRYSRWIYRENQELRHILFENSLNLQSDFEGCIELLNKLQLNLYEFPQLTAVEYENHNINELCYCP